ncbi:threonine/serine exporter family protein [Rothia sp. P5766]|uniref:threonine/serine ThrE exporter family protein n=1 Tax=Rothia sp. P5766 TaxID=3402656 RepID=UPI003ADB060F
MSKSSTGLQQKAYPSASAFETGIDNTEDSGAFGQTGLLPRADTAVSVLPATGQMAAQDSEAPRSLGGALPVVSLAQVRDPKLRDALAHLGDAPSSPVQGQDSPTATPAPASAFDQLAPPTYQVPSAFGPATDLSLNQAQPPSTEATPPPVDDRPTASRTGGLQKAFYPSVAGAHTVARPLTAPKRPSRMRSSLKSFVSTDQSLTKPMRGIARLAQRPFNIASAHRAEYVREKEEAREVLNFSLRLAETMFHYGADTVDVDSAIVAVCAAYGLEDVEIDITNQSVIINYVSDIDEVDDQTRAIDFSGSGAMSSSKERFSHTVLRVVRSWSENYAALDDIYKLITEITAGNLPRHRAERRLHRINTAKKPYSPMIIMLANMLAAFSLVLALGGSLAAGAVGGIVFLAIHFVNSVISRLKMPSFFNMAAGAGVVTFASILISDDSSIFSQLGLHVSAPHIVAAGLIMLLPTARLVSTVQDALNGFPLTAAGKFVSTGMSFLGIVVGLASAVAVLTALDIRELDITETRFVGASLGVSYLFFMLASLAFAVTTHARWQTLLWNLLIATSGFWVYQGYTFLFGAGAGRANTAFAALVIGLMSTFLAYRLQAPASIFYVPALTFLLPGLSIFRGLYIFTVEANPSTGVPGMVAAISIILSMASGVVLGSYLMQYFIQQASGQLQTEKQDPKDTRDR